MFGIPHDDPVGHYPFMKPPEKPEKPSVLDLMTPAMKAYNPVIAGSELLSKETFQPDPSFELKKALDIVPPQFVDKYFTNLARAGSQEHFNSIVKTILKEEANNNLLVGTGWRGFVATLLAGSLSPTMLIPLVGPARGAKGVAQAFYLALGASALDETILQAAKETLTVRDAAIGITAGTVIGGTIGGGIALLRPAEKTKAINQLQGEEFEELIIPLKTPGATEPTVPYEVSPTKFNAVLPRLHRVEEGEVAQVFTPTGEPVAVVKTRNGVESIEGESLILDIDVMVKSPFEDLGTKTFSQVVKRLKEISIKLRNKEGNEAALQFERATLLMRGKKLRPGNTKGDIPITMKADMHSISDPPPLKQGDLTAPSKKDTLVLRPEELVSRPKPLVLGPEELAPRPKTAVPKESDLEDPASSSALNDPDQITFEELDTQAENISIEKLKEKRDIVEDRSIGAAQTNPLAQQKLKRKDPYTGWVLDKLSFLNPVTRVITQTQSRIASKFMAMLSDGGLKMQSNVSGVPHALGGTVENRAVGHQGELGKFYMKIDDAFSRYFHGDKDGFEDRLQGATWARIQNNLGNIPEGKMDFEEWGKEVFRLANTGEEALDINTQKAVKALLDLYEYIRKAADEAHTFRKEVTGDDNVPSLFDPDGNLGAGVKNYVNHIFDTLKITANSRLFKKDIANHAIALKKKGFIKSFARAKKSIDKLRKKITELMLGTSELREKLARSRASIYNSYKFSAFTRKVKVLNDQIKNDPDDIEALRELETLLTTRTPHIKGQETKLRRLQEQSDWLDEIDSLDVNERKNMIRELEGQINFTTKEFETFWNDNGAESYRFGDLSVDFTEYASEVAMTLYNKLTGTGINVSGLEILQGLRGSELSRTLNLPFEIKLKWLETNPEYITRHYIRHLAPDIEMYRAFGSVNGAEIFSKIREDFNTKLEKVEFESSKLTDIENQELNVRLSNERKSIERDITTVIQRIRNQRGISDNPDGLGYRFGRFVLDLNAARLMGSVTLSSIPDLARTVFKSGIKNSWNNGFKPMFKMLGEVSSNKPEEATKNYKLLLATSRHLGNALNGVLARTGKFAQIADLAHDSVKHRTSKVERFVGFLANKIGDVGLFNIWTDQNKVISNAVAFADLTEGLHIVGGNKKVDPDVKAHYAEVLASLGIDATLAREIWPHLKTSSTLLPNGSYLPNLEDWVDYRTMAAYRAAVNRYVNTAIVTPDVAQPSWVDANMGARLIAQFRSFTFTSTNHIVFSSLQDYEKRVAQGILFSLGLGGIGYYLYALSRGGETLEKANEFDLNNWANEMVSRSGVLGIILEAHAGMETMPLFQTLLGSEKSSRQASKMMSTLLGPSYGTFINIATILQGIDYPTQSTLHKVRLMVAYQNVFYLRRIIDGVEKGISTFLGLPKRRK